MRRSAKLTANLVAVALVSVVLAVYAWTQLLVGDPTYPLEVRLPDSGGLLHAQEVTVSGRVVGTVRDVRLEGEAVVARLAITEGERVPVGAQVVVLRRSPVGEQALDFRPTEVTDYHEPGDTIDALDAVTPVPVQRLLGLADEVFEPVDADAAATVVRELADAVRGRRETFRGLITDSARFSEAVADHGDRYDELFASSRQLNAVLAEHRQTLARSIGEMADAAQVLVDMRGEFEGLLAEAPPLLVQVGGIVDRSQANLSCTLGHLAGINTYLAQPHVLEHGSEALRVNQWFFVGFDILSPRDPWGAPWNRIEFMPPQEPPADSYLPAKRPIPDILPGGACSSPFGEGAPSATQVDFSKTVPEARVVRPEHDRADPVRISGPPLGPGVPAAAPAPTGLPATGGGGLPFLLGLAVMAAASRGLRRHTGSRTNDA